jgi:hypothetical protein
MLCRSFHNATSEYKSIRREKQSISEKMGARRLYETKPGVSARENHENDSENIEANT